jgi:hypothetical protein
MACAARLSCMVQEPDCHRGFERHTTASARGLPAHSAQCTCRLHATPL